jgi:hypothetical protein
VKRNRMTHARWISKIESRSAISATLPYLQLCILCQPVFRDSTLPTTLQNIAFRLAKH